MKNISARSMVNQMCTPAQVYLVLAFLSCLMYVDQMVKANDQLVQVGEQSLHGYTVFGLAFKAGFAVLWTFVLNYICKRFKHGNAIAWVILLLPLLFLAFVVVMGLLRVSQMVANGKASQRTASQLREQLSTLNNPAVVQEEPIPAPKVIHGNTYQPGGYDWQGLKGFNL